MIAFLALFILDEISDVAGHDISQVKTEDVYIYEGDDFAQILKTTLFVDKTLLIKRFFDKVKHGEGVLILTPKKYGKSTNINMLKRFYQMNVNKNCEASEAEKSLNLSLFKERFLKIYQISDFFNQHFGKYPIIHIDYKSLSNTKNVEEFFGKFFGLVMMKTFLEHQYLLNDKHIWSLNETYSWIDKEKFTQYIDLRLSHKLSETDIRTGFSLLAKLLHKRFEKRVIVLMDNYDAFIDSPLYSQTPNIFHLLSAVNFDLLRSSSVERSLVTGQLRSGRGVSREELLPSNVGDCEALHEFYGLSGQELEALLEPYIQDDDERQKAIGKIVHNYSGYGVATLEADDGGILTTQGVSVWSVVQYLEKELNVENMSSLV
ncbi:uncharacterized protein LOC128983098 [Macrosteles quadrilineatus]|uniref:uncharacterized protein LOC128983098 n=1 Tax=Macrosteles quadrilineatus TaxID=74068 RepID=UPI0023E0F0D1|nr:uncharacterized protein LOC128983098 [Macrosteles quadrilineatus]